MSPPAASAAAAAPPVPLAPPRALGPDGAPRRVGVEIEFAGIDARRAAALAQGLFGGEIRQEAPHVFEVSGTSLDGDVAIELDIAAAHPDRRVPLQDLGEGVASKVRAAIVAVGQLVMPFEVGLPPLPVERLGEVDRLVAALREAGAEGTGGGLLHAFGLHLNPEAAALDAGYLADHLRAFAFAAPWLRTEIDVDLVRAASPFIRPYPDDYVRKIADPAYRPSLDRLIDDYLDANPTRDRELDMLPILAHLDPERVRARARGEKVKPRPAFHYRLPDSRVDEPGWCVVADWNRWVMVERLAADPERLAGLGQAYLDRGDHRAEAWVAEVRRRVEG